MLRLSLSPADFLAQDNEAWAVVNPPRRTKVLLVTPGNAPLSRALRVPAAQQWSDVSEEKPAALDTPEYRKEAASGALDLVIYDRCAPKQMPQANTLFIGSLPPVAGWGQAMRWCSRRSSTPIAPIRSCNRWNWATSTSWRPGRSSRRPGSTRLIESNKGPLMAIAAREGFEDAVLGFELDFGRAGIGRCEHDLADQAELSRFLVKHVAIFWRQP